MTKKHWGNCRVFFSGKFGSTSNHHFHFWTCFFLEKKEFCCVWHDKKRWENLQLPSTKLTTSRNSQWNLHSPMSEVLRFLFPFCCRKTPRKMKKVADFLVPKLSPRNWNPFLAIQLHQIPVKQAFFGRVTKGSFGDLNRTFRKKIITESMIQLGEVCSIFLQITKFCTAASKSFLKVHPLM